jgi:hypothetical protein
MPAASIQHDSTMEIIFDGRIILMIGGKSMAGNARWRAVSSGKLPIDLR